MNSFLQMTLNVYNEPQFSSTEAPDATFRGSCILVSKIHEENYITKEKFDSYNVYEIMLDKQNSSNFTTSMFNGRVMVQIRDRAISDAVEYDFSRNIRPSVGRSTLLFQPLDDWNEKRTTPRLSKTLALSGRFVNIIPYFISTTMFIESETLKS